MEPVWLNHYSVGEVDERDDLYRSGPIESLSLNCSILEMVNYILFDPLLRYEDFQLYKSRVTGELFIHFHGEIDILGTNGVDYTLLIPSNRIERLFITSFTIGENGLPILVVTPNYFADKDDKYVSSARTDKQRTTGKFFIATSADTVMSTGDAQNADHWPNGSRYSITPTGDSTVYLQGKVLNLMYLYGYCAKEHMSRKWFYYNQQYGNTRSGFGKLSIFFGRKITMLHFICVFIRTANVNFNDKFAEELSDILINLGVPSGNKVFDNFEIQQIATTFKDNGVLFELISCLEEDAYIPFLVVLMCHLTTFLGYVGEKFGRVDNTFNILSNQFKMYEEYYWYPITYDTLHIRLSKKRFLTYNEIVLNYILG